VGDQIKKNEMSHVYGTYGSDEKYLSESLKGRDHLGGELG
jgi:hypothetical protein